MTEALTLYTSPMSRGRTVRWMLEEVGTPYRAEIVALAEPRSDEYLAVNPLGKVPAIRHRGVTVTECAAICAYLADAFPAAGLAPPPEARGEYYRWLFFFAGPVEAAVVDKMLGVDVPKDRQGMVGYGSYARIVDALERMLEGRRYVAGDRFSAADVYCGSMLGYSMRFGSIESRPAFAEYWKRVSDRDARRRATELDDALLPPEQRLGI